MMIGRMGALKNLKVSKKLTISYAIILTLLIISCAVSIVDFIRLGGQIETFYDGPFTVNDSASVINSNFERMQKSVYRSISNTDSDIVKEAITDARNSAAIIQEQLPVVKAHFMGDQQIIDRLDAALAKLAPMREYVLTLSSENQKAEAADYMEHNNILAIQEAQVELNSLIESGNKKGEKLVSGLREKQAMAVFTVIILGGHQRGGKRCIRHLHNTRDHSAGHRTGAGGACHGQRRVFGGPCCL